MAHLLLFLLLLSFSPLSFSFDTILLPRPLILEREELEEQTRCRCSSWRVAGEANNLAPWLTVPAECANYVKEYMIGRSYRSDLDMVVREAVDYARSVRINEDGKDAWVFDLDETLLSNLPYYADHAFGLEVFSGQEFDKWVSKAMAPAIQSTLKLYEEVLSLGFKIFLLTGRGEQMRTYTVDNLIRVGFRDWEKLILRGFNDHGKTATIYKSEKRSEIIADGYRIVGNSGDQWSDLLGFSMSSRSFKFPNPMYFIP